MEVFTHQMIHSFSLFAALLDIKHPNFWQNQEFIKSYYTLDTFASAFQIVYFNLEKTENYKFIFFEMIKAISMYVSAEEAIVVAK